MAKEFLNYSGLSTYDNLIKDWVDGKLIVLTQEQYNALTPSEQNNGAVYFIVDGAGGGAASFSASAVTFNNTGTGLVSTNVQTVIIELLNKIATLQTQVSEMQTLISENGLDNISIEE